MQRDTDRSKKKKEEPREEDEFGIFHFGDGSLYEGRVCRREAPTEASSGILPSPLAQSNPRAQQAQELPSSTIPVQHGKGIFRDAGGAIYDGEWAEGTMGGEALLRFPSGATYAGSMYANNFYGVGTYTWPDGSRYEGQWESSRMHGLGTFTDSQGQRWVGKFNNGHGIGLLAEVRF
ncbi:hypothetical protein TRVL_06204 [Trypanosoma vivax]|uniref:Uncharacterized protein n=1 Tax=Trypanosoma vivax (strain Y486) TaxID=1055687 RepID=G0TS27_TRYVY|nr:hypothetical protein TRVL_06204 [Trypanosoma vivax]CCC46751.1 conserved hypothetical protein [Trypanosoma vivax Y486]